MKVNKFNEITSEILQFLTNSAFLWFVQPWPGIITVKNILSFIIAFEQTARNFEL